MRETKTPVISAALLDQLLSGVDAQEAFAKDGLFDALKKALAERVLNAEMNHHLAAEAGRGPDEPPQWREPQDGSDRYRGRRDRGPA